jgi:glycine oxidase
MISETLRTHTVVVGAGVVGLSIAWRLAQRGRRVAVLDRRPAPWAPPAGLRPAGAPGPSARDHGAASAAAAGMISTYVETEFHRGAFTALGKRSLELYPDFVGELESASGIGLGYRTEPTLEVALDRDDEEEIRFRFEYEREVGLPVEWLSGAQAREIEPALSPRVISAVSSEHDHHVDNRAMVRALAVALERAGGEIRGGVEVTGLDLEGGRVHGVRGRAAGGGPEESYPAESVVVAGGAWSPLLEGLAEDDLPPVRPVKGQAVAVGQGDPPLLGHVVHAPDAYLVPRTTDGVVVIGSSSEEKGFETELTAGPLRVLLEAAWEAVPGIDELPLVEVWSGLRPASRDGMPILGPAGPAGLALATGHYRKGILLAPVTALALADLVEKGSTDEPIGPFGIERFRR